MENGFQREVLERLTKIETKLDDYKEIKEKNEIAYTKSMNNEKDMYATLDTLILDLYAGNMKIVKNGACNTYIKNKKNIKKLYLQKDKKYTNDSSCNY